MLAVLIDEDGVFELLSESFVFVLEVLEVLVEPVDLLSEVLGVVFVGAGSRGLVGECGERSFSEDIGVLSAVAAPAGHLCDGGVGIAGLQHHDQTQTTKREVVGGGQAEIVFDGDPTPGRG